MAAPPDLELREFSDSDIESLARLADNPRVSRFLRPLFPCPYTLEDARWWVEIGCRQGGAITRAILIDGDLAGGIGIHPQSDWRAHQAELGYWLGESYWGRGIATRAVRLMVEEVFSHQPFTKLFAPVMSPNKASMRVLEKCGFTCEGILRAEVVKEGRFHDLHYYALQRPKHSAAPASAAVAGTSNGSKS